jgi:ribonuclease BN (tRNA processing enzyme)
VKRERKASGWYVELGNGEKFLSDLGGGTTENLAKLRPEWSEVDKVFASATCIPTTSAPSSSSTSAAG